MKPITREEMYLAKMAGQDVETPEPVTRREMFLDEIAKNGGVSSWNDLTDKPFYEETKEEKLVPDTTYTDNGGIEFLAGSYPLEEGASYLVEWDGKRYDCVGTPASVSGYDLIAVGNLALVGAGDDNGMPFAIGCVIADGSYAVKAAATGDHTFSILGEVTELKRIDPKFLPEGVPYEVSGAMVEVLPETTVTLSNGEGGLETVLPLTAGNTYTVNWNGTEYSCVAQDLSALMAGAVAIGNLAELGMTDTGEPFAVAFVPGQGTVLLSYEELTSVTVSIVHDATIIQPIDPKFLPEGYPYEEDAPVEVFPETSFEVESTGYLVEADLVLEEGETYIVTWNGTEYTCTAIKADFGDDIITYAGSFEKVGLPGNGEPFAVTDYESGASGFIPWQDTGTCTLGIKKKGTIIHTIDKKYLPDDIGGTMTKETEILPLVTVTIGSSGYGNWSEDVPDPVLSAGKTYYVTFDGTKYEVMAKAYLTEETDEDREALALGACPAFGIPGNGEPFGVADFGGSLRLTCGAEGEHTIRIVEAPSAVPAEPLIDFSATAITLPTETTYAEETLSTSVLVCSEMAWCAMHGIPMRVKLQINEEPVVFSGQACRRIRNGNETSVWYSTSHIYRTDDPLESSKFYVIEVSVQPWNWLGQCRIKQLQMATEVTA